MMCNASFNNCLVISRGFLCKYSFWTRSKIQSTDSAASKGLTADHVLQLLQFGQGFTDHKSKQNTLHNNTLLWPYFE